MDFLQNLIRYPLEDLPFVILVLLIAFSVHEFAHAYSAYKFGDPTAKLLGRVSLNPRVHLSLIGVLFLMVAGFGWAKPVPVNRSNFKRPRLMGIIVSAAGPVSNLILAFIGTLLLTMFFYFGWLNEMNRGVAMAFYTFFNYLITINLALFIFNLIPLPPLDGYRIVEDLAPPALRAKMSQYEQWGMFILLLLVFITPVSRVTLGPLFALSGDILTLFNDFLSLFFRM